MIFYGVSDAEHVTIERTALGVLVVVSNPGGEPMRVELPTREAIRLTDALGGIFGRVSLPPLPAVDKPASESSDLLDLLRDIARQLDSGLAVKLGADVRPGHCDYISKQRAAMWCEEIAKEIRRELEAVASCQTPVANCQGAKP